jgi:acyl-coenzyme A synthetase/AMP-(fatty) acid ligase
MRSEAAAVPVHDELRGRAVERYVSLKPRAEGGEQLAREVSGTLAARDRGDRDTEERVDRARHAEDPLGQDHAPG